MRKKIGIYAIPFGFGPIGKAMSLAAELNKLHDVTIITFDHALQIAERNRNLYKIVDCECRDFEKWGSNIFDRIELFISIMDLRFIAYLIKNHPIKRTIFVDSLFWWRKNLNDFDIENTEGFIIQSFPGVAETLKQVSEKYLYKFNIVSPIVYDYQIKPNTTKSNYYLLHFGGVSSLIINWNEYKPYFRMIFDIVYKYIEKSDLNLIVAGNQDVLNYLNTDHNSDVVRFICGSHYEFQGLLINSTVFISTCGIEATYEAFYHDIPTVFLPPLNSTQLQQTIKLKNHDLPIILSNDLIDEYNCILHISSTYQDQTERLATFIGTMNKKYGQKLKEKIHTALDDFKNNYKKTEILKAQNNFYHICKNDGYIVLKNMVDKI